ncbi:TetR/AcrR family transcriptional regulator [Streptosporangium fragile]|uniref:TetR/AcrR family transcriptional regulator n=1 Tax=Streptosporangium fragile TaxID=46186 RepID=UPI0031EF8B3D
MSSSYRLPRGRNALPPEEVERLQRERLCRAMAEVMAEKGYVATSVEDVLKRARVSRLSFYRLFDSKLDCFMAAFDHACELLFKRVMGAIETSGTGGDPMEGYERAVTVYLEALEAEWPYTRVYLVEVYAAGPEAVARRRELNAFMASFYADALGITDDQGLLTCRMLVAATSALVTIPVAENDRAGLRAVAPQLIAHVRTLWDCGAFGAGTGRA